jgi:hypothetical protein
METLILNHPFVSNGSSYGHYNFSVQNAETLYTYTIVSTDSQLFDCWGDDWYAEEIQEDNSPERMITLILEGHPDFESVGSIERLSYDRYKVEVTFKD